MEEIAEVYSRSLFEVARDKGELDRVHDELGEFADALNESRELQVFFFSPYFSSQEKKEAIGKLLEGASENFARFLELLAERHRMPVIFRIRKTFDDLWREENKLLPVTLTSAVELDSDVVEGIGKKIEEQTGQSVELTSKVDDEVLGGIVLQVGNMVLDASVRARLEKLRKNVAAAA